MEQILWVSASDRVQQRRAHRPDGTLVAESFCSEPPVQLIHQYCLLWELPYQTCYWLHHCRLQSMYLFYMCVIEVHPSSDFCLEEEGGVMFPVVAHHAH